MNFLIASIKLTITYLAVFSAVPFFWWFFKYRKEIPFFSWVGFIEPRLKSRWWILAALAVLYCLLNVVDLSGFLETRAVETIEYLEGSVVKQITIQNTGHRVQTDIVMILSFYFMNFFGIGVGTEIFFRGFLCKRLCSRFGTDKGIVIQAFINALIWILVFFVSERNQFVHVSVLYYILTLLLNSFRGLLLGSINEKVFNGSVIPSMFLVGAVSFILSIVM